jgi:4'-phosphopantetheinyl transferase
VSAVFWTGDPRSCQDAAGLTPNRIDVYHVAPELVTDGEILNQLATVLDDVEQTRWHQLAFAANRHDFLVSHALVRNVLSLYANVHPAAWSFRTNRFGRPEIEGPSDAAGLRFNLSHTAGLIAVAVGGERDVGVDVENVTRDLPIEAAASILSPAEIDRVRGLADSQRREHLLELWTLKEAYAKGRGLGLSLPLGEFSFDFGGRPNEVTLAYHGDADHGRWLFELHRPTPVHRLALAYDAAEHGRAEVRIVPLIARIDA